MVFIVQFCERLFSLCGADRPLPPIVVYFNTKYEPIEAGEGGGSFKLRSELIESLNSPRPPSFPIVAYQVRFDWSYQTGCYLLVLKIVQREMM